MVATTPYDVDQDSDSSVKFDPELGSLSLVYQLREPNAIHASHHFEINTQDVGEASGFALDINVLENDDQELRGLLLSMTTPNHQLIFHSQFLIAATMKYETLRSISTIYATILRYLLLTPSWKLASSEVTPPLRSTGCSLKNN